VWLCEAGSLQSSHGLPQVAHATELILKPFSNLTVSALVAQPEWNINN